MQPDIPSKVPSSRQTPRTTACAAAIFFVAAGLRLAASRGDLVFDEVWTRQIVSQTDSAWKIPLIGKDNNHILNTLVVYALGLGAPPYAYRLPAALAGSVALWFGYLLARRDGRAPALVVLTLLGFSHPLIVFGTEARGYAYLACCTMIAWWALEEYLDRPRAWLAATFAAAASLGFLAHLTFAFAYAGFGFYSVVRLLPRRGGWRKCLYLHFVPVLTGCLLYVAYIKEMEIGGGAQYPLDETLIETLSLSAGGPARGGLAIFAAAVAALLIGASLISIFWRSRTRSILYFVTMFVAPAAALLSPWAQYQVIYPRYFLVPMLFAYVAMGTSAIVSELARVRARRWTVGMLLAAFVTCNLVPVARLIAGGRGQYAAALRWIAEHSAGPVVTLASDHDFRNTLVIEYYLGRESRAYANRGEQLVYFRREQFPADGTEWFLLHSFSGDPPHPGEFTTPGGIPYRLEHVFRCQSVSGWSWWLYRRQSEQAESENETASDETRIKHNPAFSPSQKRV